MIFLSFGTNGVDRLNGRKPFDDFTPIIVVRARDRYDLVVKHLTRFFSLFLSTLFATSGNNFLGSINPIL